MKVSASFKQWPFSKLRVDTFSDAVFAIVMTLLVLELKLPHIQDASDMEQVKHALIEVVPVVYSWAISFFFVGIMWLHHHQILHMTHKADYGVAWINLILLFFVCLLPFPTGLMGEYPHQPFFVMVWGLDVFAATLSLTWFYYYNTRNYLTNSYSRKAVLKNVYKTLTVPLLYLIASLLAWVSVYIAFVIYFFIPFLFLLPLDKETNEVHTR